ncbi:MAG: sigma-70 family RNA polymerase sigma factor [Clostridia bacterium]|nr:sigma-70 family RNA polymerase sigma factor [Clostridia bacterium]
MNGLELQERANAFYRSRSQEALEAAAEACLPLCAAIARRFSGRGADEEDLRQVAAMACVKALHSYSPEHGAMFSTYAAQSAAGAVRNHLRDHAGLVRTPRSLYEQSAKLTRARAALTQQLHREPTVSELASALNWTMQQTIDTLMSRDAQQTASFDDKKDDDGLTLMDTLGQHDPALSAFEQNEDLKNVLSQLDVHEQKLLKLRYFDNLSQRVVAQQLGMTQMQVSRAERRLLSALKERLQVS